MPATNDTPLRRRHSVLGAPIDVLTMDQAVARISAWAAARESRYVCICNAHSVVTAGSDPAFADALQAADLSTPDGAPVAWLMRRQGASEQHRVSGPDLMLAYCEQAERRREPIFLLGSTEPTLERLRQGLEERFPDLLITGSFAPPFRPLSDEEEAAIRERIHASGARTVWVGLGCPKQELWMHRQKGRLRAVTIGVGAAFDFHSGTVPRAPVWMQESGLEWLFRLGREPRRLGRRYLTTNTTFLLGAMRQLLSGRQ